MLSGENNEKLDIQREVLSSFLIPSTQKFAYLKNIHFHYIMNKWDLTITLIEESNVNSRQSNTRQETQS